MRIALVQCPDWGTYIPPLGITYLASFLRSQNHDVHQFDFNIELFDALDEKYKEFWNTGVLEYGLMWRDRNLIQKNIKSLNEKLISKWAERILDTSAEIIGFSIVFTAQEISMMLAEKIKEKDSSRIIVFGGFNYISIPEREIASRNSSIDAIVINEGEKTLSEMAKKFEKKGELTYCEGSLIRKGNKIIDCGIREPIKNLDSIPFPDFSDLPMDKYKNKNTLPILMSRGCVNRCVFCIEHKSGCYFRTRSAENVLKEIRLRLEQYNDKNYFNFNDSLINGNLKVLDKVCDIIIKENLNIQWEGNARISSGMNLELLKKMKKAGCRRIVYGVESGSQKVLESMKKNFKIEDAAKVLKNTHEAGIIPVTNWIIGFPTESEDDFQRTLDFVFKNKDFIRVGPPWGSSCVIIPGTDLDINKNKFGIYFTNADNWMTDKIDLKVRGKRLDRFRELTSSLGLNFGSGYE